MGVADNKTSFFQSMVQRFASTPLGAWFFARTAHHLDRLFFKLNRGSIPLVSIVSGLPAMLITTTGAKSKLPRSLHLVFIRDKEDGSRLAVVASNLGQPHNPGWYYNLKAHPQAVCTIDGYTKSYIAHEAFAEE
jgi:deazaflavin-dependent oxidoreductase (nitroreductase family)